MSDKCYFCPFKNVFTSKFFCAVWEMQFLIKTTTTTLTTKNSQVNILWSEWERGKCNFANYESRIFSGLWLNNFFTTTKVTLVVGATNKFNCIWVLHFVFFLPTLDPKYLFVSRLAANMLRPATGAVHCSKNTKISNSVQQLIPLRHVTSVNEALM